MIVALACTLVLAASLAPAGEATTDEAPAEEETVASTRVLLVTATADAPTDASATARLRRTRAELEAAGFDVLEIGLTEPIDDVDRERLAALADEYDARALTVLHPVRVQAEVWTIEGDADPERRAVVVGGLVPAESDAVFALRVAEVLQATLIAVEVAHAPKPQPKATPPPPPAPKPELAPRWGARVGAHAAGSTGDLGFMFGPTLGTTIAVGPKRRVGIDVEAFATALPGRTRSDAGRASIGFGSLRGTIGFWPLPTARVSPGVGLGWGMLVAWTRGRGTEPWSGRRDVTVVSTPVGAGDLAIAITRRFRIRIGFRIGVALPAVRVQTSTTTIRTAQPIADGGIAFEIVGPGRR